MESGDDLFAFAESPGLCEALLMSANRISRVTLDDATILRRNADIEQEREVAMRDLEADNTFTPVRAVESGLQGPWEVHLAVAGANLALIRRVAVSLLRRAPGQGSGVTKRLKAGWDDSYLLQVIQGIPASIVR